MGKSNRDQIRSATLGQSSQFDGETVNINGVDIEVRKPNVKSRYDYVIKSRVDGEVDTLALQVNAIIECCYVPGTDEKIFDVTDKEVLINTPVGGFFDKLWNVVNRITNVEVEEAKKL